MIVPLILPMSEECLRDGYPKKFPMGKPVT